MEAFSLRLQKKSQGFLNIVASKSRHHLCADFDAPPVAVRTARCSAGGVMIDESDFRTVSEEKVIID